MFGRQFLSPLVSSVSRVACLSSGVPRAITQRVRGLKPSSTLLINEASLQLKAEGKDVYRLGFGQSPFPVPNCMVEALQESAGEKDYLPVQGLLALRDQVAEYHRAHFSMECNGDDVMLGPGSKELLYLAQLCFAGDLLLPNPSWVSYAPQASIIGDRAIHYLPTSMESGWKIDPSQLAAHCEEDPTCPRMLVLNYPSNPTGQTYSATELAEIAKVCRQYNILAISDEIYGLVDFGGDHATLASFYPEGTIISSGLSKGFGAGGWRLGTYVFPPQLAWLRRTMCVVASETFSAVSSPIQHAAVHAYGTQGGGKSDSSQELSTYLAQSRRILSAVGLWTAARLRDSGIPCLDPQGGFYVMPDFTPFAAALGQSHGVTTSPQFTLALLRATGVAMLPGTDFGRPPAELTTRLAFVDFDGGAALAAAPTELPERPAGVQPQSDGSGSGGIEEEEEAFLRRYCPRTLEGVDRIARFVEEAAAASGDADSTSQQQ